MYDQKLHTSIHARHHSLSKVLACSITISSALVAEIFTVANGVPLTEEEVAELAKRHIDDAVATVAEMQLTAEQLKVHTLSHIHDLESSMSST